MSRGRGSPGGNGNRRLPPLLTIPASESRIPVPTFATSPPSRATTPVAIHGGCSHQHSHQVSPSGSRYHSNCFVPTTPTPSSCGGGVYFGKFPPPRSSRTPRFNCSGKHLEVASPSRMMRSTSQDCLQRTALLSPKVVTDYLKENPSFVEDYVMSHVDLELLERWMIRKTQRSIKRALSTETGNDRPGRKTSLSRWKFCVHADKRKMLQELTNALYLRPHKAHVLSELAKTICSAVNADSFDLFMYDRLTEEITKFQQLDGVKPGEIPKPFPAEIGTNVTAYVARTKEVVRITYDDNDLRFPDGLLSKSDEVRYALCYPVVQPDGELSGVLELYRRETGPEFHEEDEEIVNSYLVWGGIALHYAEF